MLRYNLKLIYRNFKHYKGSFFLNLFGLSLGMACALMICLWVNDELQIDKFHEKDSRLFYIMTNYHNPRGVMTAEGTSGLLAGALEEELPEVEKTTRTSWIWVDNTLFNGKDHIRATGLFADTNYFNVFSYELIQGNKDQVLEDKNTVLISESLALKLFNTAGNVIGRSLEWQNVTLKKQLTVAGVFEDIPANSSRQFDMILPYGIYEGLARESSWKNPNTLTYVVLKKEADPAQFNRKIQNFLKSKQPSSNARLFARQYSDGYLYGKYENGVQAGGRISYVRLFSIIAVFILIIACINFMNLSTARASRRLKEVGIKKAVGASRSLIILQYLGESLAMACLSSIVALLLVMVFLHPFNMIAGKQLSIQLSVNLILAFCGFTLFTGLLAGSYPALYLSGFNPLTILKGKFTSTPAEGWTRKGLVVFQFSLSIILMLAVLVVYRQMELIQTKNLGFNKDQVLYFAKDGRVMKNPEAFLSAVKRVPGVINASCMEWNILDQDGWIYDVQWEGKNPDDRTAFTGQYVYYNLIETLGISIKEGRSFSRNFSTDSSAVLLNETAVKAMGLQAPVGKTIKIQGEDKQVIGVVNDFHFQSLHEKIRPFIFGLSNTNQMERIMVRIKAGKEKETLERLREFYKTYNPGYPLDYKFLMEDYQAMYEAELRVSALSKYFAGLAVLISCLGLFGLAAFTAERRQKEIGIRKVLGATVSSVTSLISREFIRLVLISILIASPIAWYIMNRWLQDFAYRIEIQWWMFALAGLLAVIIALLTVSFQSVRAALMNPVKSLRSE